MTSQSEFARIVGVSRQRVRQGIEEGRLRDSVAANEFGVMRIVDLELAKKEWGANTDATKRIAPDPTDESLNAASQRLKAAQADLAELKYKEAAGELVLAVDVERRIADEATRAKTRLLAIPSRAKQVLPHLTVSDLAVLEGLVREALEELAGET